MKLLFALALLAFSAVCVFAQTDEVTSIPFFTGNIPFKQYAGYITVDQQHGRRLFYWFIESQRNPATDPVVLWLNGGPGCSSLDGLLYEHGPFHFKQPESSPPNDTLYLNPNSWNKFANMIYLEAPAGVGFSYSNTPSDYHTNDVKTASDNYHFLQLFFKQYPQFAKNDFYISGESYAGIYVPTLAYNVVAGNAAGNSSINIKGIAVGNGVTDWLYDTTPAFVDFAWYHGLYSNEMHKKIVSVCNGNFSNPSKPCQGAIGEMFNNLGNINIYDIYLPCYANSNAAELRSKAVFDTEGPRGNARAYRGLSRASRLNAASVGEEVPCIDSSVAENYLNRADVRKALHAEPVSNIGNWYICSNKVQYTDTYSSVIPFYKYLFNKIRILVYSGDTDGAVPYTGTEAWIDSLNLPVKSPWKPWSVQGQVAGYVTEYDTLTFLTIKGAGHMVPQWKPVEASAFFSAFLNGQY